MVRVHVAAEAAASADEHRHVFALDDERVTVGAAQVALAERGALEQLSSLGEVLAGDVDVAARLEDQELDRTVQQPLMGGAARYDHVVAFVHGHAAEHRLEHERAAVHVDELVAGGVAVERRRLRGGDERHGDLVVAQQVAASEHGVVRRARAEFAGAQVIRLQRRVRGERGLGRLDALDRVQRRGGVAVVEERRGRGEALLTHQLFRGDLAVDPVQRVALAGDVADSAIGRHR